MSRYASARMYLLAEGDHAVLVTYAKLGAPEVRMVPALRIWPPMW